jgi:hypothetical protein
VEITDSQPCHPQIHRLKTHCFDGLGAVHSGGGDSIPIAVSVEARRQVGEVHGQNQTMPAFQGS